VGQAGSVGQAESVGQAGVQSEVWDDNQVVNKVNLDVNVVIDRDNIAQSETPVNIQDNAQVDIQDNNLGVTLANVVPVNDWIDYHINNQGDNQSHNQDDIQVDDEVGDMAQLQTASDNNLTSPALPSHTFLSRVQQRTLGVGQPKTRKGQDKDEAEDMVTFYLK
jgi:hypothetical protein